jgi:hypothetical protein
MVLLFFFRYAGFVSGCQKRPLAGVAIKKHHSFITVLIARENGSASTLWKYRPQSRLAFAAPQYNRRANAQCGLARKRK